MYQIDIYGNLYVSDLAEKRLVYWRDLRLRGYMHYNAVPVAASPTLIGPYVFLCGLDFPAWCGTLRRIISYASRISGHNR